MDMYIALMHLMHTVLKRRTRCSMLVVYIIILHTCVSSPTTHKRFSLKITIKTERRKGQVNKLIQHFAMTVMPRK